MAPCGSPVPAFGDRLPDRAAALATLRRLPELGINFIDTTDSYGPDVSEMLIREALHPYDGLLIATKAGLTRPAPDRWTPNGRPAYLIAQAKGSLSRSLRRRVDRLGRHPMDVRAGVVGVRGTWGENSLRAQQRCGQLLGKLVVGPSGNRPAAA